MLHQKVIVNPAGNQEVCRYVAAAGLELAYMPSEAGNVGSQQINGGLYAVSLKSFSTKTGIDIRRPTFWVFSHSQIDMVFRELQVKAIPGRFCRREMQIDAI